MIPCSLTTDHDMCDDRGWPLHTCSRCGKTWHMAGDSAKWKGDPVYCEAWPYWWELGNWLTLLFAAVGIKKPVGCNCGCGERAEALNRFGKWIATPIAGAVK